jgi:adenylosuccinate lyase
MSTALHAITPVDGRYASKTEALSQYFSEFALIKYRVRVEIEYFIALCEIELPQLAGIDASNFEPLRDLYRNFSTEDAQKIKDIEKVTNHDVKAVEYFIKEAFERMNLTQFSEFIHFGLTLRTSPIPLSLFPSKMR